MLTRVVLAVDDAVLGRKLKALLSHPDILVDAVVGRTQPWQRLTRKAADIFVVSEALLPKPVADSIAVMKKLPDSPAVIVISECDDPREHAALVAAGCEAALYEGLSPKALTDVLVAICAKRAAEAEKAMARSMDMARSRLSDFVSRSPAMQTFMDVVRRVARSDSCVLILGETGVGKERLARAIHAEGTRASGPFVAINCGALPESLLESELFGHEKGAFTGAARTRRGLFELAHSGTVFLDEIGDMPLPLQVRLLRVLQDHEVRPLGGERNLTVDVRVMAASNRDLEAEVEEGRFREDLYYRLSVVTLTIPPLRERREDIPELVQSYIAYLEPRTGCNVDGITDEAMQALCRYSWPGNVRELINVVERALLLCDRRELSPKDLPETIRRGVKKTPAEPPFRLNQTLDVVPDELLEKPISEARKEVVEQFERAYLTALLQTTGGRVGETARLAGIQPRSLYDKMKQLGLSKEEFRRNEATAASPNRRSSHTCR